MSNLKVEFSWNFNFQLLAQLNCWRLKFEMNCVSLSTPCSACETVCTKASSYSKWSNLKFEIWTLQLSWNNFQVIHVWILYNRWKIKRRFLLIQNDKRWVLMKWSEWKNEKQKFYANICTSNHLQISSSSSYIHK